MDIVKTSRNISKTFKNVNRSREIISIFARHGFEEFVSIGPGKKLPKLVFPKTRLKIKEDLEREGKYTWQEVLGYRLRLAFEELGPAFIKFGQLLSSREDLFDEGFINEMKKLRDKVKGIPYSESKAVIEEALGQKVEDVFESIDENPIGTASIGVVYSAKLKTGENVVVKVKRPNIDKMIETDFSILLFLVAQVEKNSKEVRGLGVSRILRDFSASLSSELNFNSEALNCQRFKENLEKRDEQKIFYVPKIYRELTKQDVLVMEKLDGIAFSDQENIAPVLDSIHNRLEVGLAYFLKSFLQDGFFHADLHGGNFFYLKNGQIGIIDFGLMGSLSRRSRKNFIAIIYALLTFNYENLVYEFLDVADYEKTPDVDLLIGDIKQCLSPYVGLTVKQTNFTEVFKQIVTTLNRHELFLPRDWFIVFRSLMTLDGVGKSLNMDIDIFGMLSGDIKDIISASYDKNDIIEELVWASRDILPVVRLAPRYLKWFLKDFSKKNYKFHIQNTGYERHLKKISRSLNFGSYSIFSAILIASGTMLVPDGVTYFFDLPSVSFIFWSLGFVIFFRGLGQTKFK